MNKEVNNIYKTARKYAGLTQEQAAEGLHISVKTLSEYETGKTKPADDIVAAMIRLYNTPWLAYQHFKLSPLGQYLPDIIISDLPRAVLRMQKEVKDVVNINNELIDIAADGKLDKKELNTWKRVIEEIKQMIAAGLGVIYSKEGA